MESVKLIKAACVLMFAAGSAAAGELTLFNRVDFSGREITMREPIPDLRKLLPESVPDELVALLTRCLHKDPAHRLGNVRELARRLREIPLAEPWTDQRAHAWWREHGPKPGRASVFAVDSSRAPTLMSIDH